MCNRSMRYPNQKAVKKNETEQYSFQVCTSAKETPLKHLRRSTQVKLGKSAYPISNENTIIHRGKL